MKRYRLLIVFLVVILIGCNFDLSKKKQTKNKIINNINEFTPVVFSNKASLFQKPLSNIPLIPIVIHWKDKELYVLDQSINSIKVYDGKGQFLRSIGSKGSAPNELSSPSDFQIIQDYLYISDNYLIKVFNKDCSFKEYFKLEMRPFKFTMNNRVIYFCPFVFQNFILFYRSLKGNKTELQGVVQALKPKEITDIFNNWVILASSPQTQRIYFSFLLEDRMLAINPEGEILFETTRGLPKLTNPKIKSRHKQEMILDEAINFDIEYYDSSIYLLSVYKNDKNCLFQFDENGKLKRILDHGISGAFLFTVIDHHTFLVVDRDDFQCYRVVF